jgi:predicted P-loop ATPase
MVTSGRVGRFQLIYNVPEKYWSKIKTKKYKTGKKDSQGNIEQVELRWEACQSIVAGEHPMEGCGYRWMEGRSPSDLPLADAPESLLKMMMEKPAKKVTVEVLNSDSDKARSLLQSIDPSRLDDYDTWVKIGMAAHSVGDDSLLYDWEDLSRKNGKFEDGKCKEKWDSFKRSGISLGSLQRLAKQDGWKPAPRSFPTTLAPTPEEVTTPIPRKLEQLTSQELIEFLRKQEQSIRFNTFTHSIEIDGKLLKNVDLFYLQLAQKGFKVTKELAIDCLLLVAHENEFDPVRNYLEHVSQHVEPTYIDMLATTYLRPCDADLGEPTIYDAMLKATLINAVRRVYEPGAKHDYACVLMGGQGIRKSSFWKTLGGSFFADGIGDLASKDALLALHRSWICEIDELDHVTSKKHAGLLKSFLSRSTDLLRVPYGRAVEEYPRRGILVGTTNRDDFLLDDTGNRRFWCIPVDRSLEKPIDLDSLQLERDAIFSAAVKAYKNREPHYLSTKQENQIQMENMNYLVQSPWRPPIEAWLASPMNLGKPITTEILLTEAIEKPIDKQNRSDQMQVSTVLKTLGYSKKRKSIDNVLKYVYYPTSETG